MRFEFKNCIRKGVELSAEFRLVITAFSLIADLARPFPADIIESRYRLWLPLRSHFYFPQQRQVSVDLYYSERESVYEPPILVSSATAPDRISDSAIGTGR